MTLRNAATDGPVSLALVRLAAPLMLGSILTVLMLVTDRLWVGGLGSDALAGLGLAQGLLVVLTTAFLGVGLGTLSSVARATGAGQDDATTARATAGLWLAAAIGLVLALLGVFLPTWWPGDVGFSAGAGRYLQITLVGALAQGPLLVATFALHGLGSGRAALRVAAVAPLINMVGDPVAVTWGGLDGAAGVTALAQVLALAVALRELARQPGLTDWRLRRRPEAAALREILAVGLPASGEHLVRNLAGAGLLLVLASWGAGVVAGYTAGLALLLLLIHPGLAVGQATASLVGQALGAGDRLRARRVAWTGAGLGAGLLGLGGAGVAAGAPTLVGWFDASPAAVTAGSGFLRVVAWVLPALGAALTLGKTLHAARRSWVPLTAAACAHLLVQLPLVIGLSQAWGPAGAWWGMAAAFLLHGTLLAAGVEACLGPPRRVPWRLPRRARARVAALGLVALTGCQTVDFTEKRHLADEVMQLDDGAAQVHFQQKVSYSREGSAGGIGQSGGGGCGCY